MGVTHHQKQEIIGVVYSLKYQYYLMNNHLSAVPGTARMDNFRGIENYRSNH